MVRIRTRSEVIYNLECLQPAQHHMQPMDCIGDTFLSGQALQCIPYFTIAALLACRQEFL